MDPLIVSLQQCSIALEAALMKNVPACRGEKCTGMLIVAPCVAVVEFLCLRTPSCGRA
jgi:hypothetical protein